MIHIHDYLKKFNSKRFHEGPRPKLALSEGGSRGNTEN